MLEFIEGIIKFIGVLIRLSIEGGFMFDASMSGTGRFTIRLFYPPHWRQSQTYPIHFERAVGFVVWMICFFALYCLYQYLEANFNG